MFLDLTHEIPIQNVRRAICLLVPSSLPLAIRVGCVKFTHQGYLLVFPTGGEEAKMEFNYAEM